MPTSDRKVLVDGLRFPECPRWHEGRLWFTDMLGRSVNTVGPDGQVTQVVRLEQMAGGLGFLPDGTPLVVAMDSAQLFAVYDGVARLYCDLAAFADGHLDDMSVAADGTAYVGGVGHFTAESGSAGGGILRVSPQGDVARDVTEIAFPNGSVISADGRTLLVNETFGERVLAFDIAPDGSLGNRRSWAELPGMHPDGICLDAEGAAWIGCYTENKFIRLTADGDVTDTIPTDGRWATGVGLGGADGHILYFMTADTDVRGFFKGQSEGRIESVRVSVPLA
jgi:sugar lactone lactonase YvrE